MKIDGRCHCGYVSFEAEADPETTTLCNCTDCQTLSGARYERSLARGQARSYFCRVTRRNTLRQPKAEWSARKHFVALRHSNLFNIGW